jgi:hypothetical protein
LVRSALLVGAFTPCALVVAALAGAVLRPIEAEDLTTRRAGRKAGCEAPASALKQRRTWME